jgi:hypothetical protein
VKKIRPPSPAALEVDGLAFVHPFTLTLVQTPNGGVAAARDEGLKHTDDSTNYIAFLDSDDFWRPEHIAKAVDALGKGHDFYFTDHNRVGHHESHFAFIDFPPVAAPPGSLKQLAGTLWDIDKDFYFGFSLRRFTAQISTVVYRRAAHPHAAFQISLRTLGEDSLFLLDVVAHSRTVCFTNEVCSTCGDGINIYYSTFGWNKDFAFFTLRWFLKRRGSWSHDLVTLTRSDPDFWKWYPLALLSVIVLHPLGLYKPAAPRPAAHPQPAHALRLAPQPRALKGCAYQEDFFYRRAARGLWTFEPKVWRNGCLVGRLPFAVRRQGTLFFAGGPPSWAHIAEPILAPDLGAEEMRDVLGELLAQLPHWASLRFVCNPQEHGPIFIQVFKDADFEHTTQQTHLSYASDPSVMAPNTDYSLKKKRRDSIKRDQKDRHF